MHGSTLAFTCTGLYRSLTGQHCLPRSRMHFPAFPRRTLSICGVPSLSGLMTVLFSFTAHEQCIIMHCLRQGENRGSATPCYSGFRLLCLPHKTILFQGEVVFFHPVHIEPKVLIERHVVLIVGLQ